MNARQQEASRSRTRGVSLIEALVALAVMAFGMLGVVGMQTSLRSNADLSRQRAEAVRLAQEEVERMRNFSVLRAADAASGQLAFDAIAPVAQAAIPASAVNTTFFRETFVATPTVDDPLVRHVRVAVRWADRRASDAADLNQGVELSSMVAGVPPELAALSAMRTDRGPLQQPQGRHFAVPRGATDLGDGTSSFNPPGAPSDHSWIFSNSTGLITTVCNPVCVATDRWLLAGRVAFATGAEPTQAEAENPVDPVVSLTMSVFRNRAGYFPRRTADEPCFTEVVGANRLDYYCAMQTAANDPAAFDQPVWYGRVRFSGIPLSSSLADATATNYKVCRYTPDERQFVAASEVTAAGETFERYNARNPYSFLRVKGPLLSKNFLVISAGDGTTAFNCPDERSTTIIESNTWPHQPIS